MFFYDTFLVPLFSVSPSTQPDPVLFDETEDLGIDLTDGPVCVQVSLASRQFYLTNHKKVGDNLFYRERIGG